MLAFGASLVAVAGTMALTLRSEASVGSPLGTLVLLAYGASWLAWLIGLVAFAAGLATQTVLGARRARRAERARAEGRPPSLPGRPAMEPGVALRYLAGWLVLQVPIGLLAVWAWARLGG